MPSRNEQLDELYHLAREAANERREAVAAELLAVYLRWRPDHPFAWHTFGNCLRIIGRFDEARAALGRALESAPKQHRWISLVNLARLHAAAGDRAEAERCYAQAAENHDAARKDWLWVLRGGNLAMLGQLETAEQCHRTAASLGGEEEDEAWLNLGLVLRAQRRYAEATAVFHRALVLSPDYIEVKDALQCLQGMEAAVDRAKALDDPIAQPQAEKEV